MLELHKERPLLGSLPIQTVRVGWQHASFPFLHFLLHVSSMLRRPGPNQVSSQLVQRQGAARALLGPICAVQSRSIGTSLNQIVNYLWTPSPQQLVHGEQHNEAPWVFSRFYANLDSISSSFVSPDKLLYLPEPHFLNYKSRKKKIPSWDLNDLCLAYPLVNRNVRNLHILIGYPQTSVNLVKSLAQG